MHSIAAAWVVVGAISVAIGEFKTTNQWGWFIIGFVIMGFASVSGA